VTDLGEFLRAVWDCCAFPAEWAVACGHPDPMADWRGAYTTDAGGLDIAERAGGLVPLFERGFGGAGLHDVTGDPREGDIGVVDILGAEAGAVFTGRRWAVVAERGLAFASLDAECVKRVWRPRYG
jgi:hypothetical protein